MRIDDIYEQKCAERSDINEHLPTLDCYAARCEHVTEFGVRSVVSTWALINGLPKKVVSYDLSSPGEDVLQTVREVAREANVGFIFHQANVLEIQIEPTDLLFIDTYHTCRQLKAELNRHSAQVRKWIIMHDTETFGWRGEGDELGLNLAIAEFMQAHPEWSEIARFRNNNGLTILQRA